MGKTPVSREQFIMARMSLDTESKMVLKNLVGMGSRGHVDGFSCDTTLLSISTSASAKKAHTVTAWWKGVRKQEILNFLSNILPNVRYLISEECCKFLTFGGGKETIIYFRCRIYKAVYCCKE